MKDSKKNTGSFFILPKSSGQYLPENVQQLILLTKKNKARDLSNKLFHSNIYLPKSLQIEQLKKEILKTNNKLFLLSERNNFGRKFFENERYENDSFYNCFGTLNENEYLQYLIYSASKTDLKIDLPKLQIVGEHNLHNLCGVFTTLKALNVDFARAIKRLVDFSSLEHRLQKVYECNGLEFIDDSIATVADSVIAGLKAFKVPDPSTRIAPTIKAFLAGSNLSFGATYICLTLV